ncbi:MAG: hypothetical protein ACP5UV_04860 [Thermoplasmata archaeon]
MEIIFSDTVKMQLNLITVFPGSSNSVTAGSASISQMSVNLTIIIPMGLNSISDHPIFD